jgi:type I restriction enzyme S subunit
MKKYDSYKDSGIEWIGEIPSHWEISSIKKQGYEFETEKRESTELNEILSIGGEHIQNGTFLLDNPRYVSEDFYNKIDKGIIKKGDILTVKDGATIGKSMYVENMPTEKMILNEHVYRIKGNKFFYYIIISYSTQYQFCMNNQSTAQESITTDTLKTVQFCLPPSFEQTAIANFLDLKTSEIDEIIADKKRLLELYEEEKTAIINQAVTKGLDPNAPIKDSGIEWLGEIPEHWEVKKVKWVHQTTSGGTPKTSDPENYDGHIPWLRTLDLNNDNVYDFEIQITEKALSESSAKVVPANSVLVAMYGGAGTIGKSGLLKFNAAINQAICAILPNGITIPEYLHYFVIFFRPYWMVGAEGTRRDPNISQDDIKNKEFIFPPIQEQQSIVHHIESECSKIDFKKARTEELIELLTEYRTALISEAVTGKIKVTED